MAESAFSGGVRNPALDHITERIVNVTQSAEGTTLPPAQVGGLRVPIVQRLRVTKITPYFGGVEVTLAWQEPEIVQNQLSHFNVYTQGLFSDSRNQQGPATARRSPATIRLQTNQNTVAVFTVQTVLKSGLMSLLPVSPSVSAPIDAATLTPSDYKPGTIPVNAIQDGTPGELISWDSTGVVDLVSAGGTNAILAGNAGNSPSFKSRSTLDLVEGRSTITTPGNLLIAGASAGSAGQSSIPVTEVVQGAPNLTTPDLVVTVDAAGSVKESTIDIADVVTTATVDLGTSALKVATVTLPAADVLDLLGTPVEIIPAPGVGKIISVLKVDAFLEFNAAAYIDPGGDCLLVYGAGTTGITVPLNTLFLAAADSYASVAPSGLLLTSNGLDADTPVNLTKITNDFTTGDSPVTIRVYYIIDELP